MTVRTNQQMKDLFLEKDPQDFIVDLIDTLATGSQRLGGGCGLV